MSENIVTTPNAVKRFDSPCVYLILDKDDEVLFIGRSKGGLFNAYRLPSKINFLEGVKMVIKPFHLYRDALMEVSLLKLRYEPKYNKETGRKPRTKKHVGRVGMTEECMDCRKFGTDECQDCEQFPFKQST